MEREASYNGNHLAAMLYVVRQVSRVFILDIYLVGYDVTKMVLFRLGLLTQRLSAFRKKPKIQREDIFEYYSHTWGLLLKVGSMDPQWSLLSGGSS